MSFAEGFAVPAGLGRSRQFEEDAEEDPMREDPVPATQVSQRSLPARQATQVVSDDENADDDAASTDSMASSPLVGPARYKRSFKSIVRGVFKVVHTEAGIDHEDFKRRVGELRKGARGQVDEEALFLHAICHQYATAAGLENGDAWEKWPDMKQYYDDELLPRFVGAGGRRKRAKWNFDLTTGLAGCGPAADEFALENAYTTRKFLDARGLGAHEQLHERLEAAAVAWLRGRSQAEPPALPVQKLGFIVHAFRPDDAAHFEALLPGVMEEQLREDVRARAARLVPATVTPTAPRALPTAASVTAAAHQAARLPPTTQPPTQPHGSHPAGPPMGPPMGGPHIGRYTPTTDDLEEGLDPEEKVTWNAGVLQKMNVYATIESSPHQARILTALNRALTVEDAVSQIAMKCGANYVRKPQNFQPQPQMNEEKRRIYTRAMLPAMFACANEVMETYVYRFK